MIRVLIVDDDRLARQGLMAIVPWAEFGMTVVGDVSNGAKALEFTENNEVDLMIIDMSMPFLSGPELMEELHIRFPHIKFVALTFHEDFDYMQTALRLGALDYLSKSRLSTEEYRGVFERIRERMKQTDPYNSHLCGKENENAAGIEEELLSLAWLYNDDAFDKLYDTLLKKPTSMRYLDRSLAQMSDSLAFMGKSVLPEFRNQQEIAEWLREYRASVYFYAKNTSGSQPLEVCILKSILYVKEKIGKTVHTDEIASYVGMSRSYFSTCFRRVTGLTFNDFVRNVRVRRAKELLLEGGFTVQQVASAVGYEDVKYFSRVYYRQTGITPGAARQQELKHPKNAE